jgi:hypothetical protein
MSWILPDILQTNKMMIMAEVIRLINDYHSFLTSAWHSLPQQVSSLPLMAIPLLLGRGEGAGPTLSSVSS